MGKERERKDKRTRSLGLSLDETSTAPFEKDIITTLASENNQAGLGDRRSIIRHYIILEGALMREKAVTDFCCFSII